jgi:hypothetical protein
MTRALGALILLMLSSSSWAQVYGYQNLPYLYTGPGNPGVPSGTIIYFDSLGGASAMKTLTGGLVDNDLLLDWTNTAPNANHAHDLIYPTNYNSISGANTTNPIYRATFGPSGNPCVDFSQKTNGNVRASIGNLYTNSVFAQPFTTALIFKTTAQSGSPIFPHGIWEWGPDNQIGNEGAQDVVSPPWTMEHRSVIGFAVAGPVIANNVWFISVVVWNGANSYWRTNGVDAGSGNLGAGGFYSYGGSANSFGGFEFGNQVGGDTSYYICRFIMVSRQLSTNEISSLEAKWRSDYGF